MTGISLDDVNSALHWLLYHRELIMSAPRTWILSETNDAAPGSPLANHFTGS